MAQLPRIEFSHLHKPLRRVLGAMNYFERLLRDGRDEWERFQREHSDRTGKPKISYEEEFNRRGEALVEAVGDATQIVKPLSGCLSTRRPGPLEYAGIPPATSVAGWILFRAGLFHEMYLSRSAQGAADPEESSIEEIIELYKLPEPYDQQYIERLLEEELCFNPQGNGDSAAENVADPSIAESGQPTMAVGPLPEFAYWPDGDGYFIRAFGESGNLSAERAKGLHQIFRLIQSPSTSVKKAVLINCNLSVRPHKGRQELGLASLVGEHNSNEEASLQLGWSQQDVQDPEGLKRLGEEYSELKNRLDRANNEGNTVDADIASQELKAVTEQIQAAVGIRGRSRQLKSRSDNERSKINSSLKTAYTKLRNAGLVRTAQHFEACIGADGIGFGFKYESALDSDSPSAWKTEKMKDEF
jgi:hypothetical protein